jgi:2-hydroxy-6-oxonona-2,4-dienedioate hydrolase
MARHDPSAYRPAEEQLIDHLGLAVTEHRVPVDDRAAVVRVLETGSGPAMLFVHGSPNAAATWLGLAAELPHRRCILLERPGAGLSDPVEWRDHRAQSTEIQRAVLDHLGVGEVDAVGSSFGGLYVLNLAAAHPERVRRVDLLGSPGGVKGLPFPKVFRGLALPIPRFVLERALKADERAARSMFAQIGHEGSVRSGAIPPVVLTWYAALLSHTDTVPHLAREARAIGTPRGYRRGAALSDADVAAVAAPIHLLWGDRDPFAAPDQADLFAAATGASIEHLPGAGHLPWFDDAALVAERLTRVAGIEPEAARAGGADPIVDIDVFPPPGAAGARSRGAGG